MIFGRYPAQAGCFDNEFKPLPADSDTFMNRLRVGGYRTHGIGKCHFTPHLYAARGFETRETSEEMFPSPKQDDYTTWLHREGHGHLSEVHGVRGEMYYVPQIAQMPATHHPTQWVGNRASAFVREQAGKKKPWYLFASFIHPHPPFAPPVPWHKLYRAFDMPAPHLPPGYEDLQVFINKLQNRYKYRDRGFDFNLVRCIRAAYYACVSFIDFQIGRILRVLEETGQLDRTLIVFSSDHGELLGDYGCFGKRSMHDASARIPMVLRYPAWFKKGARSPRPVSLIDLAPTFLEAAGMAPASGYTGISLRSAQSRSNSREFVFSQFRIEGLAVYMAVSERWKYIYSAADQREFVFDRRKDPGETVNGANRPGYKRITVRLRRVLQAFLRHNNEPTNLDPKTAHGWKIRKRHFMSGDPDKGLVIQDPGWADFTLPGYSTSRDLRPWQIA